MNENNMYITKQQAVRLYLMCNSMQSSCLHSLKQNIMDNENNEDYRKLAQNWFKESAEEYDALCMLKAQCWKIIETIEEVK